MGKKASKRSPKKATPKRPATRSKKTTRRKTPQKADSGKMLFGQKEAADYWGRTTKTIQTWMQNGLPATKSGRQCVFDVELCQPWVDAFLSESESSESTKLNEQLKEARLREQLLKNDKLEREKEIAEGNLVPLDEYELFAAELVIEARDQLLNIPKEMRRHLCKKCQKKVVEEMTMVIENTLQRLAAVEGGPKK
ncbi:Phage DNA packaging protein Nu1 [Gimesia panareensis]|uniref:Phage DNA packaging protein Nu1 n=1 Tax=Gimesia panareensis TaxID=2527978 RepID=A0A517Q5A6_9PLAN|nr:terminase small subunit [Gimesia panareensis]QDT26811.1 Phage DNA packaging protein Nu1 [Gimesia panareensis]